MNAIPQENLVPPRLGIQNLDLRLFDQCSQHWCVERGSGSEGNAIMPNQQDLLPRMSIGLDRAGSENTREQESA
ncbi:MAG: hypothetical protein ACR2GA_05970 [Chloroflexota bacterium]